MPDYDFPKDTAFEILCAYVREPEKFHALVEPQYFTHPLDMDIARVVRQNREKHPKDVIREHTLLTLLQKELSGRKQKDRLTNCRRHAHKIFKHKFDNLDTLQDTARDWVTVRRYRQFLVAAEQNVNAGHPENIPKLLAKAQAGLGQKDSRIFHTYEDFHNAPKLTFAIEGFLQNYGATLIGGLSGHGKTFIMLSMAKALLSGKPLWGYFKVKKKAKRVLYLIPESSIVPLKPRLKKIGLYKYVKDGRLLVHTLSAGPKPKLSDPRILTLAKRSHVFLDTAIRFGEGSENDANDNQQGLATDIFALLSAGAKTVTGAHHSPKQFEKERFMTLENVLRGTADIGAMVATAWGVKQVDSAKNILHIENIKPRDFEPCKPFQIVGRPWIDQEGDFRMYKRPGTCGALSAEQPQRGGAPLKQREAKDRNQEAVRLILEASPNMKSKDIVKKLELQGINVKEVTVRKYKASVMSVTRGA